MDRNFTLFFEGSIEAARRTMKGESVLKLGVIERPDAADVFLQLPKCICKTKNSDPSLHEQTCIAHRKEVLIGTIRCLAEAHGAPAMDIFTAIERGADGPLPDPMSEAFRVAHGDHSDEDEPIACGSCGRIKADVSVLCGSCLEAVVKISIGPEDLKADADAIRDLLLRLHDVPVDRRRQILDTVASHAVPGTPINTKPLTPEQIEAAEREAFRQFAAEPDPD
jgi:hypothetical protein